MLSVIRSPLPSPALRTMASAFSYIATPSSPLSHPSYSTPSHIPPPTPVRTPRESYPSSPGNSVHGSYFNTVGTSTTPCRFNAPCSPASGSLIPSPIPPIISSILLSHGISNNNAVKQLGLSRLSTDSPSSQANLGEYHTTMKSVDTQVRRKPMFKLALPRQILSGDDLSETSAFTSALYSLGTPGTPSTPRVLAWSDSFDSVMTLKPIKGRVPTPYPKMDDSVWIEDVEEAIVKM